MSGYNQHRTLVFPFNSGANAGECSVTVNACTDVGRGSLKQPAIECLTLGLSRGMNVITLRYCYSEDYPTRG